MFVELLAQVVFLGLVVWRISYALSSEEGPWGIFEKIRNFLPVSGALLPLSCFNCLVLVTGSGAALLVKQGWLLFLLSWSAISAVALVIDTWLFEEE